MAIDATTTAVELAALVSQSLETAGTKATLSGGGAVNAYTDNMYKSKDLDFVTSQRRAQLSAALEPLGVALTSDQRHFKHPNTDLFLEFPAAPLEFGGRIVQPRQHPTAGHALGPVARRHANPLCNGSASSLLALE